MNALRKGLSSAPCIHGSAWRRWVLPLGSCGIAQQARRFGDAPSSRAPHRSRGSSHRSSKHDASSTGHRGPVKDRYPPMAVDLRDPRRRLAVLVDGTSNAMLLAAAEDPNRSAFFATILPAILRVGTPVLVRLFAHDLPPAWERLICGGSSNPHGDDVAAPTSSLIQLPSSKVEEAQGGDATTSPQVQLEFFRVERFIPVSMQMQADAVHVYDFREQNKVEGVCFVCHEADRAIFEEVMKENTQPASPSSTPNFFNQYLFDELGMVKEQNVDGRPADGA